MSIMFNCLCTIPLCNFGIAFSHAICFIAKYFGKLLLKTIWQPKSSPIFYYPGENRNLKSPNVAVATAVLRLILDMYNRSGGIWI